MTPSRVVCLFYLLQVLNLRNTLSKTTSDLNARKADIVQLVRYDQANSLFGSFPRVCIIYEQPLINLPAESDGPGQETTLGED